MGGKKINNNNYPCCNSVTEKEANTVVTGAIGVSWNVYKVSVDLAQSLAGMKANTPEIEFVVEKNQPSNREFEARQEAGEEMITNAELAVLIRDNLNVEGPSEDTELKLAVFRRCREHRALYVPSGNVVAAFAEAADWAPKELSPTGETVRIVTRIYPPVLHFTRDGQMLLGEDGIVTADENRVLRGNPLGPRGRRSIEQRAEAIYGVTIEFFMFVCIGSRRMPKDRINLDTIESWFVLKTNMASAHRSESMNGGLVLDHSVEEIEKRWQGNPAGYQNWEHEDIKKGWAG